MELLVADHGDVRVALNDAVKRNCLSDQPARQRFTYGSARKFLRYVSALSTLLDRLDVPDLTAILPDRAVR